MRKFAFLSVAFALVAVSFYGCDENNPIEPVEVAAQNPTTPSFDAKPISHDAYIVVEKIGGPVPQGFRGYDAAVCPVGMFPVGGKWDVIIDNVPPGGPKDFHNTSMITAGVTRLSDGTFAFTAGVANDRPVADPAHPVMIRIRAFCFEAGFLKGHEIN